LTLVDAYEQLRLAVGAARGGNLSGLAVQTRKGMAAWMHDCAAATRLAPTPPSEWPTAGDHERIPSEIQCEVVDVLATMALATA
jgi:hypothetical protein